MADKFSRLIAQAHTKFENGDKWGIVDALRLCVVYQRTMPDWLFHAVMDVTNEAAVEFATKHKNNSTKH